MHDFVIGRLSGPAALSKETIDGFFQLRYRVFHERLAWDVRVDQGRERDEFDDADTVYVIGTKRETGVVEAGWRLRPSTSSYMLKSTFPQLLVGSHPPLDHRIWEFSRFAVVNTPYAGSGTGSFGQLTRNLFAHTAIYGKQIDIEEFIWVTSMPVERMVRRLGYRLIRIGQPCMIGNVHCVANRIVLDGHTLSTARKQLCLRSSTLVVVA